MHISAHMEQTLPHIGDMRIMHRMAVWHISMQSSIMHIISMVMELFFKHIIMVSMHIVMHMEQSSIHRCMDAGRSIIIAGISILLIWVGREIQQSLAFQLTPIPGKGWNKSSRSGQPILIVGDKALDPLPKAGCRQEKCSA